uniref:Uncharacterized protein n=1 Tax=Tanacetum cinerariifolium TaxID=118510 RepID=A0A6L2KB93_TANCI|nr:hypothetical protein [Tanacetum cinerariifolium]
MEILLVSTSNSTAVVMRTSKYSESNAPALEDLILQARNPVKENNTITKRSDAVMHGKSQDEVLSKVRVATKGETKYGMKIPEVMPNDDIKQSVVYKVYVIRGRSKGLMKQGGMVINAGSKQKKATIKKKNLNITLDNNITNDDKATRLEILFNTKEERKRCKEFMAKERNSTLMIEKDVDYKKLATSILNSFPKKKKLDWINDDSIVEHNWFSEFMDANKDPKEDKIQECSTIMFAKKIKEFLKIDKLTKADLKGAGFELLKSRLHNIIKLEDAALGIHHLNESRKWFYKGSRGVKSRHDVYSKSNILSVKRVEVKWKFGYGFLPKIEVKRVDGKEHEFREAVYPELSLNDIEDMYLLKVQWKMHHLDGNLVKAP